MEDGRSKQRVHKFMDVVLKNYLSQAEQFHVGLRKKRFLERTNLKRGIPYSVTKKSVMKGATTSKEMGFDIPTEIMKDFRSDAHIALKDAQEENLETVHQALTEMFDEVENHIFDGKVDDKGAESCYRIIFKTSLITLSCKDHLTNNLISDHIPEVIRLMDVFLNYPFNLKRVLFILFSFSYLKNCGDYFRDSRYNFPEIAKAILAEHQDLEIINTMHSILGNLAFEDTKTRDMLLDLKFTEHIAYIISEKGIDEKFESDMTCVISLYLNQEITDISYFQYFDCLLPFITKMLDSSDEATVNNALSIRFQLTKHSPRDSEFYEDLCNKEVISKIIEIGQRCNSCMKNCLLVLCHVCCVNDEAIEHMIEEGLEEILFEVAGTEYYAAKGAAYAVLFNLSLSTSEILDKLIKDREFIECPATVFDSLVKDVKSGVVRNQISSLKILANVFQTASLESVRYLINQGYLEDITTVFDKDNSNECILWGLVCVKVLFQRETYNKEFTTLFEGIEGFAKLEALSYIIRDNSLFQSIEKVLEFQDQDAKMGREDHLDIEIIS
ncbi:unnamed protein product [Moneuplotes crassus]|uniref:Uncharacterized protein n=1 Tax=Euplotes crassus TaxID=5936 RepID=A0AAD1U8V0_EUPCR|nr:unnamed protein product [Moneuplotes crassus]